MASYSSQTLLVSDSPVGFDVLKMSPSGRNRPINAVLHVEGGSIRFRTTGVPTVNVGFLVNDGDMVTLLNSEHDIEHFKAIALDPSSPATIYVEFFNDLK
jgi:hypothetical protein